MENLLTNLGTVYYYINGETIFKCADNNYYEDPCARKAVSGTPTSDKEVKMPSFVVTSGNSNTTYYLTNFINCGDIVKNNVFYKHPHVDDVGNDVTIADYYKILCEKQIKSVIAKRPSKDFDFFNEHKDLLGIPLFMLSNSGYTLEGMSTISFTKNDFNKMKEDVALEETKKAANNKANEFGYKVNTLTIITI